jgi:hypothetical protein
MSVVVCNECNRCKHCPVGQQQNNGTAAAADNVNTTAYAFHLSCDCVPNALEDSLSPVAVIKTILKQRCCSYGLMQPILFRRSVRLLAKIKCAFCGNVALTCNWNCCPSTSNCSGLDYYNAYLNAMQQINKYLPLGLLGLNMFSSK